MSINKISSPLFIDEPVLWDFGSRSLTTNRALRWLGVQAFILAQPFAGPTKDDTFYMADKWSKVQMQKMVESGEVMSINRITGTE